MSKIIKYYDRVDKPELVSPGLLGYNASVFGDGLDANGMLHMKIIKYMGLSAKKRRKIDEVLDLRPEVKRYVIDTGNEYQRRFR